MCHLSDGLARTAIFFVFPIGPKKTHKLGRWTLRSIFLSSFVEFCSAVSEEKSKMSQPQRGQGGHLVFRSARKKNVNLVEDVEMFLPVQFCWIPFSDFQRRSRKCLSKPEARAAILFFRSAQKTQTWSRTLRSCFLSSFVQFRLAVSEEKSKM